MIRSDVPNHHRRVLMDLSFTRVIACRVGTSVVQVARTGEFGFVRRERPPRDVTATTADGGLRGFPPGRLREFTLQELRNATNGFSREWIIGRGGFGEIFRGILADGTSVAIKVWNKNSGQGLQEFKAELRVGRAISSGSHPCLIPVIGYHFYMRRLKSRAMIVYAFMDNGDVGCYTDDRQLERTPLDWPTRKRIALGVARGIRNLHELGIVHRDIKPSNIMLDEYFEAHLGDFGLAKSMGLPRHNHDIAGVPSDEDSDHFDTTQICGTTGYLAPEVYEGYYSRKSDVFGFGMTLIQLVTGKPAIDRTEEGPSHSLVYRTVQLLKNGEDLMRHMHPGMLGKYDEDEAFELIRLGLICTEYDPEKRPLMQEVVAIMEGSVDTLKQRWDNYDYHWIDRLSSAAINQITGSGDVDEMPNASDIDTDEEEFRENDADMIRSEGNRRGRRTSELETELSEMRDQMLAMELNHQAEMEEMRQKQTELMQSMVKMRERHMQQVKEEGRSYLQLVWKKFRRRRE